MDSSFWFCILIWAFYLIIQRIWVSKKVQEIKKIQHEGFEPGHSARYTLNLTNVPYSGKLSREKTSTNIVDLGPFVKVFSTKKGRVPCGFYHAHAYSTTLYSTFLCCGCVKPNIQSVVNPRKFCPRNLIFHWFVKVSRYMVPCGQ